MSSGGASLKGILSTGGGGGGWKIREVGYVKECTAFSKVDIDGEEGKKETNKGLSIIVEGVCRTAGNTTKKKKKKIRYALRHKTGGKK